MKGRGDSHEARSKYIIRFLTEYDLQDVIKLQEIVLHDLKDPEIYYPASQEKLKKYLSEKTFALGVLTGEGLIGFSCIHTPGDEQDNLGRDIAMSKEDLKKVAHIKFSGSSLLHVGRLNWIFPSLRYIIRMRFFVVLKPLALLFAD